MNKKLLKGILVGFMLLHHICMDAQPVLINEVMVANASAVLDPDYYNFSEWVELYNPDEQNVNLSGYYLSKDTSNLKLWQIPVSTYIPAKGYLVLWMDKINRGLHTSFRARSNSERLLLSDKNGKLIDSVHINHPVRDQSYGRHPDGSPNWSLLTTPTPETANVLNGFSGQSLNPVFSSPAGRYETALTVALENPSGNGNIYYTTDGSEPTIGSMLYDTPVTIESTSTLKARIMEETKIPGPVVTNTYFINEHAFSLPAISVSTNPDFLTDPQMGIYVTGENGAAGCNVVANYNRDWERAACFEYFDKNGVRKIFTDAGIKINGNCSRTWPQKSLGVYFRDKYGNDGIRYPLFQNKSTDKFKSIVLRNAGNDFDNMHFRDGLMQTILYDQMDVDAIGYSPSALYLNGNYWGILNIREKPTEDYLYSNYGIDEDSLNLLENNGVIIAGDSLSYAEMVTFLESHDLSVPENYDHIASQIDIESYIDYQFAEIFYSNLDWPGNNNRFWRTKKPGSKWRWILFDTDVGFGLYFSGDHNTLAVAIDDDSPSYNNAPWSTLIFRKLLENNEFRNRFIDKSLVYLGVTFRPERVNYVIDSLIINIADEMAYHLSRWDYNISHWESNADACHDFANQRPGYMIEHIKEQFDLQAPYQLEIGTSLKEVRLLSINEVVVNDTVFKGAYFNNRTLRLKAYNRNAFKFRHWEIVRTDTANTPAEKSAQIEYNTQQELNLTITAPTFVRAVYDTLDVIEDLLINEFCTSNSTFSDEAGEYDDWIELYNMGSKPLNLGGLYITDDLDQPLKYRIPSQAPASTTVNPGEFILLWADEQPDQGILHVDFKLNKEAGAVGLFQKYLNDTIALDTITYSDLVGYDSYGRYSDGTSRWFLFSLGTPGESNIYTGIAEHTPDDQIILYPNPTHGIVRVSLPETSRPVQMTLLDYMGKTLQSHYSASGSAEVGFDVSFYPEGMYVIRISNDEITKIIKFLKLK